MVSHSLVSLDHLAEHKVRDWAGSYWFAALVCEHPSPQIHRTVAAVATVMAARRCSILKRNGKGTPLMIPRMSSTYWRRQYVCHSSRQRKRGKRYVLYPPLLGACSARHQSLLFLLFLGLLSIAPLSLNLQRTIKSSATNRAPNNRRQKGNDLASIPLLCNTLGST